MCQCFPTRLGPTAQTQRMCWPSSNPEKAVFLASTIKRPHPLQSGQFLFCAAIDATCGVAVQVRLTRPAKAGQFQDPAISNPKGSLVNVNGG